MRLSVRLYLAGVGLALASACGKSDSIATAPESGYPPTLVSSHELIAVGTQPVPLPAYRDSTGTSALVGGNLALYSDSSYALTFVLRDSLGTSFNSTVDSVVT